MFSIFRKYLTLCFEFSFGMAPYDFYVLKLSDLMFSVFGPQLPLLTFSVCGAQHIITCVAIAITILAKAASYISQPVIT